MVLRRNNSQNAGCMRRSPASHCCQVRQVVCRSSAAVVCESPAASRAARTSSGVGFRAGLPARLRLGWLGIFGQSTDQNAAERFVGFAVFVAHRADFGTDAGIDRAESELGGGNEGGVVRKGDVVELSVGVGDGFGDLFVHFWLQPLSPEARLWRIHTLNNTRIARKVKRFLKINSRGRIKPSNLK